MDRIQCDWGEKSERNFHVIADHASLFLFCKEYKQKTTENSVAHVKMVAQQFGRPLECLTDNGPSYHQAFKEALGAMGIRCFHGASYNPRSQAIAEKAVGRLKTALDKNPVRTPSELQDIVSGLNWISSSKIGSGSASDRFFGRTVRGLLPAVPGKMSPEAHKLMLDTLKQKRACLAKKFWNHSDASFQLGQRVLVWNRRDKRYSDKGTVVDLEESDDGLARSFIIDLDGGSEVHLHSNHLLPAPNEDGEGQEGVGAV